MKTIFIFGLLLSFLNISAAETLTSQDYPVQYCGTIFAYNSELGGGGIHIASKDENGTILFDFEILPGSTQAEIELAKVVAPNDQYIGCVGAESEPVQGFEGLVLTVQVVELMGQTSGFSVGRN